MSNENENMSQPNSGSEPAEELSSSLAAGDTEFVTPSDEKKPQTMQYAVLAGFVLLAPMAIWYMYKGKGPSAAEAANQASPAAQTVHTFLDTGQDGVAAMRSMLQGTEKIVKEFLAYPSMAQVPLDDLKTNPFRARQQQAVVDDSEAASKRRKDAERETTLKAVQALHLQSIMSGKRGACMINNAMYTEGQQVGQFTIEKISQGIVIVKSGAYRFELKMQK